MKNKILLIGKFGEYFVAQKNEEGDKLIPSSEKVFAKELIPYGFDFNFGGIFGENVGIRGYGHEMYKNKGKNRGYPEREEYPEVNLEILINNLENKVDEKDADYILVDDLRYDDANTSWEISGRAQILIKR
ncbi:MAG: hypothetical protein WC812_01830 [Candidatus Pacearchaeota archaeon]|jgi:hypothetical protein